MFILFLVFEQQVSPLQVIQVLLDRKEDANNVCRRDQLATNADGQCARVEINDVFSSSCATVPCWRDRGAKNSSVTRFFCFGRIRKAF